MTTDEDAKKQQTDSEIKRFLDRFENEIQLHWKRNSHFLLSSSILLVVLGLLRDENIHLVLGILGVTMNSVWLLVQHRSSQYVGYYKSEISKLDAKIFPQLPGRQMRFLGYVLPIPFILIWVVVIGIALHPDYSVTEGISMLSNNSTQ